MTFLEYSEFERISSKEDFKRNISFYDPTKGWVLDPNKKAAVSGENTK